MAFNTDGTKMYIIGRSANTVFQYNLSTGFDLSTASYSNTSFSVGLQANWPNDVSFSTDGTKMYVTDTQHPDTIYQYSLSTAFDVSTASYNNVELVISTNSPGNVAFQFSRDGTKMFVIDGNTDEIQQYSLTSAFDVSTATYDNISFSTTNEDTIPYGLFFNPEGTRLYLVGTNGDQIVQYNLGTGFDLSTISYSGNSVSVVNQDTTPRAVAFSADGTRMFMLGSSNNTIYQYST
jgi:DNA-binding beta-propeller fold protein YncE